MNARRRFVLRVRDGHWLAALGLILILILAGCTPKYVGPHQNDPGKVIPNHCTHVSGSTSKTVPCPTPHTTAKRPNPGTTKQALPPPAAVPKDATGFCHDGTYTTLHSDAGKTEQCDAHGGVAEG